MEEAFDAQEARGDIAGHRLWIGRLLEDYYDPMYAYQLSKRAGRRIFSGNREAVAAHVREELIGAG